MASTLKQNQFLTPGQEMVSNNQNAKLIFQADSNLVLYAKRGSKWRALWASNTQNQNAERLIMQEDGNLVMYRGNIPVWATNTLVNQEVFLVIQDDENLVMYMQNGRPVWASNTWVGALKKSSFKVQNHGLKFINSFPDGKFGALESKGLCGGMCYTVLDYYYNNMPVPTITSAPSTIYDALGIYIKQRQWESVMPPSWHGAKFLELMWNPDPNALKYWSTHDEWDRVVKAINDNKPVVIGLIIYLGYNKCHQVVVFGYQDGAVEKRLYCYDPNHPRSEMVLSLSLDGLKWKNMLDQTEYAGFFVESAYTVKNPLDTQWSSKSQGQFVTGDNDIIQYRVERGVVNNDVVEFVLELGPGIDWWKAINIPDGIGNAWDIECQDQKRRAANMLWAGQVHNRQSLVFKKAKEFGRHQSNNEGYKVNNLEGLTPGSRVIFTWIRD